MFSCNFVQDEEKSSSVSPPVVGWLVVGRRVGGCNSPESRGFHPAAAGRIDRLGPVCCSRSCSLAFGELCREERSSSRLGRGSWIVSALVLAPTGRNDNDEVALRRSFRHQQLPASDINESGNKKYST